MNLGWVGLRNEWTLLSSLEKLKFHVGWHEVFSCFLLSDVLPEEGDGSRGVGARRRTRRSGVQRLTCIVGPGWRPRPVGCPVHIPQALPAAGRSSLPAKHGESARPSVAGLVQPRVGGTLGPWGLCQPVL